MQPGVNIPLYHSDALGVGQAVAELAGVPWGVVNVSEYFNVAGSSYQPPPVDWLPYGIQPDIGQNPAAPFSNSSHPALVELALRALSRAGHTPVLKLLLEPKDPGAWRGYVDVNPSEAVSFLTGLYQALSRWAPIAERTGAHLCLATEMSRMTHLLGPEWLRYAVAYVRSEGFNGPVSYCANWFWDNGGGADWRAELFNIAQGWRDLDYIGISAYWELDLPTLQPGQEYTTEQLVSAWARPPVWGNWLPDAVSSLRDLADLTEREIVFLETGCGAFQGAALAPSQGNIHNTPASPTEQRAWYEALWQVFGEQPWMRAACAWLYSTEPGLQTHTHNIRNQPALVYLKEQGGEQHG